MKKPDKDNRYFQNGINGLLVVCGGIFFYYILFHSDKLSNLISSFFAVLTPFIIGFAIAYIFNPVMKFIEEKLLYKFIKSNKLFSTESRTTKKVFRLISTFLAIIIFLAMIYSLIIMLVPQIISNIQNIIDRLPEYFLRASDYYNDLLRKYPKVDSLVTSYFADMSNWFNTKLIPNLETIISTASGSILGSIITIFKSLINFIIGVIISIYLLIDKEKFQAQSKKIIYALYEEEHANNFINNIRYANKIFGGFFTGKVVDSIIIGIICYICMLILKLPYAALISMVVGVTNIIPYFGPFIGAIPSAFILLLVSPKKCLVFLIFVLVLQQFDGNILGPKILGDSTGLNSFWVIFSITVFSGFFGLIGMFIGVPVFAVIYAAIRTFIDERLLKKNMPVATAYYKESDFKISEDESNYDGGSFRFAKETFDNIKPVISDDEKKRRERVKDILERMEEKDDDANV